MNTTTEATSTLWVNTLPFDVRLALAACEAENIAVDEYSKGATEPVFYEIEVDFLSCSTSLGSALGAATNAVRMECTRRGVASEHITAIVNQIRVEAISASYEAGLSRILHWVAVRDADDED